MPQPTVLLGFAESFAAIEASWSLQKAGMSVVAFARRGKRSALQSAKKVLIHEVTPPEVSIDACIRELEIASQRYQPDAVLPLDDASLWLTIRMQRGRAEYIGPSTQGADLALDKQVQIEAADAAGLTVPATMTVASLSELDNLEFPAVVKPAEAVRQDGDRLVRPRGALCADETEYRAALNHLSDGRFLVQPQVIGVGEGVFGYVDEDGPTALSAHRRVRMVNPQGSASSACVSIGVPEDVERPVLQFLETAGWRGLFMVEFLRDTAGIPWFMELNGRAWGSLALARRRGFEYPAWAAQYALGLPRTPSPPVDPPTVLARHIGRELAHLLFVMRGPQSRALTTWPGRVQTVRDLLRFSPRDRFYNWQPSQPLVFATDTIGTLRDLISGRSKQ